MDTPKNIFFYWDGLEIPHEVLSNVENYKRHNPDFNVVILNDEHIDKYKGEFPETVELFHLATIAALKSDIIRFVIMYKEGGIWLDSNTTLTNGDGVRILYDRYRQYDFVITILTHPEHKNDLKTSCLISKPNSQLAYDAIMEMTELLDQHHQKEEKSQVYIPYNYFVWVGPPLFYRFLNYRESERNGGEFVKDGDGNIITLGNAEFEKYRCGLMDVDGLLRFYGCNMEHHHGKNMHKHWSRVQQSQKLFKPAL